MKGIIISYQVTDAYNITKLNNELFGRVVKVKRKNKIYHYYYNGLLENYKILKLGKGCYFINTTDLSFDINLITSIPCNLEIDIKQLQTVKEIIRNKYKDIEVINL
jgi:hypothetical protein